MSAAERRTIDELLIRYELEPSIKDVFVEGKFDQEVISNCFRNAGQHDRIVYEIDTVDIPKSLLLAHGLTLGNKQRVIALARELAKQSNNYLYKCFVDRDLDHWFGNLESTRGLIWSKYCSIELHFFSDELLKELLITVARTQIDDWESYYKSLITTLSDLYALRLTDRELDWSLKWLPIDKFVSCCDCRINLNLKEYRKRLLLKNRKSKYEKQFDCLFAKWKSKLRGDHRCHIRGHDFIELLTWTVDKFNGIKAISSSVAIERILVACAPRALNLLDHL